MGSLVAKLKRRVGGVLWRTADRWFLRYAGGEKRPVFFDVERTCPALRAIDRNFDVIRAELEAVLPSLAAIPRYHDVDPTQAEISGVGPSNWRTLFLHHRAAGSSFPNRKLCPRTVEILDTIPNLGQAFFSILEPKKSVPAHCGRHYYYLRYHTGLYVPKENPPSIRVKDLHYTWKERESVLFDDSWEHEVENTSDDIRVVLIIDVIRPASWPLRLLLHLARTISRSAVRDEEWASIFKRFEVPPEVWAARGLEPPSQLVDSVSPAAGN